MIEIWNEETLNNFIEDEIEENLNLDYKAAEALGKSDSKKKEISKDVSAMANSDGGIIIYGIAEYNNSKKSHLPERIDPILRKEFSKEWLEQIINTNIFPRISNIKIIPIKINNSDDEVAYVVEIPKSNTAHQAIDKRYYKRYNFESIAMYDYEIKDILNRSHTPILSLKCFIEQESYEHKRSNHHLGMPIQHFGMSYQQENSKTEIITFTHLIIYAYNEGKVLANYVNCFVYIPKHILKLGPKEKPKLKEINNVLYVEEYCDNTTRDIIGFSGSAEFRIPNYGSSYYEPILPKTRSKLKKVELNNDLNFEDFKIFWIIYADNAEPINGEAILSEIEVVKIKD